MMLQENNLGQGGVLWPTQDVELLFIWNIFPVKHEVKIFYCSFFH